MSVPACRRCRRQIDWKRVDGRWVKFEPGGGPEHDCRTSTAPIVKPEPYVSPGVRTIGENYRPFIHLPGCSTPPWEACPCPRS